MIWTEKGEGGGPERMIRKINYSGDQAGALCPHSEGSDAIFGRFQLCKNRSDPSLYKVKPWYEKGIKENNERAHFDEEKPNTSQTENPTVGCEG